MVFSVIKSLTLSPGPLSLMIRPNRELGSLSILGLPRPLSPGRRPGEWGCELTAKFPAQVGAFWKKAYSLSQACLFTGRTQDQGSSNRGWHSCQLPRQQPLLCKHTTGWVMEATPETGPESACFFLLSYYWLWEGPGSDRLSMRSPSTQLGRRCSKGGDSSRSFYRCLEWETSLSFHLGEWTPSVLPTTLSKTNWLLFFSPCRNHPGSDSKWLSPCFTI